MYVTVYVTVVHFVFLLLYIFMSLCMYMCRSGMVLQLSKAAMLQKGADYIRQLRTERSQLHDEMDSLRQQIECLNTAIRYPLIVIKI